MDHDLYEWSVPFRRPRIEWPGGAKVAFWVMLCLQWFPLDAPGASAPVPGALDRPYPDYRNYSHRDYGNRIGVFRLIEVLDALDIRATVAVNAAVCTRYRAIVEEAASRGWEFIGHGVDMGRPHHDDLSRAEEVLLVREAIETLQATTGTRPQGWLSPGNIESSQTLELIVDHGIKYVCDWVNDEMPYHIRTDAGPLLAMPYAYELSDIVAIWLHHRSMTEFCGGLRDHLELILTEADRFGGRVLGLVLTPWIMGQPHRVAALRRVLDDVVSRAGVWVTMAGDIAAAFAAQETKPCERQPRA